MTFLASCAITGEERACREQAEAAAWLAAHVASCPFRHGHAVQRQTGPWEAWNLGKGSDRAWTIHEEAPGGTVTSIRHKETGEVVRVRRGPPPPDPGKA